MGWMFVRKPKGESLLQFFRNEFDTRSPAPGGPVGRVLDCAANLHEEMRPIHANCPERILRLLTPHGERKCPSVAAGVLGEPAGPQDVTCAEKGNGHPVCRADPVYDRPAI